MTNGDAVVSVIGICSRNRPLDLKRCLEAVAKSCHPGQLIIVVDSSDDDASEEVCNRLKFSGMNLVFYRAGIGLTLQRNFLIKNLPKNCNILHFIDDDSVVEPDYFKEIESTFHNNEDAVAVGGRILNLPRHTWTLTQRIFLVSSKRQGVVLPSGVNIMNFTGAGVREVDWLSGCSMSFRTTIFSAISFDLNRPGNGVGEDVDFCLKAKAIGKILWTPHASQQHLQSPVNRLKHKELRRKVLDHRLRLAKDQLGGVVRLFVYTAFYFETIRSSIRPVAKRLLRWRG